MMNRTIPIMAVAVDFFVDIISGEGFD